MIRMTLKKFKKIRSVTKKTGMKLNFECFFSFGRDSNDKKFQKILSVTKNTGVKYNITTVWCIILQRLKYNITTVWSIVLIFFTLNNSNYQQ